MLNKKNDVSKVIFTERENGKVCSVFAFSVCCMYYRELGLERNSCKPPTFVECASRYMSYACESACVIGGKKYFSVVSVENCQLNHRC